MVGTMVEYAAQHEHSNLLIDPKWGVICADYDRNSAITTGVVNKVNIAMFMWLGHVGWRGAGHDDTSALSSGILPRLPENSGEI